MANLLDTTRLNQHTWGTSRHLYVSKTTSLATAIGKAGGASSLHFHESKQNAFIVIEGIVEIWGENSLIANLRPQEACVVSAGTLHRMVFMTDAALPELYQVIRNQTMDLTDIVRVQPGWKPGEKEVVTRVDFRGDSAGNPGPACFPG